MVRTDTCSFAGMERILITGPSGNVGSAILSHFRPASGQELYLARRSKQGLARNEKYFDFEDPLGCTATLATVDVLFLLRPPHISDVKQYFEPLIDAAVRVGLKHIVFLSVQGADTISFIPHAKIERLIRDSGINYTFIRPSYFMQNLTTTLLPDIRKGQIVLPAGKAGFLWVDVSDIGRAIAAVLADRSAHINRAYTITGDQILNFYEVASMIVRETGRPLRYLDMNPVRFYFYKRKEGLQKSFALVMILLHFLPRFQKPPAISDDLRLLSGSGPLRLEQFIRENRALFTQE